MKKPEVENLVALSLESIIPGAEQDSKCGFAFLFGNTPNILEGYRTPSGEIR
jgi:hypothetical protein